MKKQITQCHYLRLDGTQCPNDSETGSSYCFWHDPSAPKNTPDIKERLEAWGKQGHSMEGFELAYADLTDLDFGLPDGTVIDLKYANLHHANLHNAHLFKADLRHANLMKAVLSHTTLNQARFHGANMLGTDFYKTKLEHVYWGGSIYQEYAGNHAKRQGNLLKAQNLFFEGEEVYRALRKVAEEHKFAADASDFFYKEMLMRHNQYQRYTRNWLKSLMLNFTTGYGEKPFRVFFLAFVIIWMCAIGYFFSGIDADGTLLRFNETFSFKENVFQFFECLYFSIVTFTTLGYGDIRPVGWITRTMAASEAFLGAFTTALFVVIFVRKVMR